METATTPVETLSYEEALKELESLVAALEGGEHALETSIALYERGQQLARHCSALLEQADLRIKKLSGEDLVDYQPES